MRATVVVPPELVMTGLATAPGDRAEPGQLPGPKASLAAPPAAPGGLPRRQRPASNGSAVPGLVPQQGSNSEETQRWPSAGDLAGFSGDKVARPPSDLEVSGTALFSPIPRDDDTPAPPPPAPKLPQTFDVPPPRPEPEPAAETRDERDGELPSGKDLFSAANATTLSDWWNQAAQQVPEVPPPSAAETTIENTPIFDEMLSAWFRSPAQPPPAAASPAASPASGKAAAEPEADEEQQQRNWDFASDENWRTVQALSQVEPTAFTKSGLPRRRRGEQLMPGSATPEPAAPSAETPSSELPVRDPADVRGRLNSFQRGVTRGRQEVRGTAPETTGTAADSGAADASNATTSPERARAHDAAVRRRQTVAGAFGVPADPNRPGGMPQRTPGATSQPGSGAPDAPAGFGERPADADSSNETAPVQAVPPAFDPDGGWPRQEPAARTELPAPQPNRTVRPDKPDSLPTRRKGASSLPPAPPTADPNQVPAAVAGLEAAVSGTGQTPASQAAQASANGQTAAPEKTDSPASANGQASAPAESPGTEQTSLWGKPAENPGQASPLTTWRAAQAPAAAPGKPAENAEQSGTTADPASAPAAPAPAASAPAQGLAGGLGQTRVPGQNVPGQSGTPGQTAAPGQTGLWGQPLVPGQAPSRQSSAGQDAPQAPQAPAAPAGSDGLTSPSTTPAETTTEWNFGSDEGWRTVQSVSQSTPASFTSAGLPRRRRGEQLLPGSAPPPAGSASPRPSRDAHDVRGRLSSFQQGIQRGRHRTAQAAEKNHETLEGE